MAGIMSEGSTIGAHNTLSVERTDVQVFYPFHPLRGAILQVVRRPKRGDGAVTVMDQTGRYLKIPVWMLSPECATVAITGRPLLTREALLSLTALLHTRLHAADITHDNLRQIAVDERKGGQRGATTTSGPDDPKRNRSTAHGCKGANRTDRSHGPHSGGGF